MPNPTLGVSILYYAEQCVLIDGRLRINIKPDIIRDESITVIPEYFGGRVGTASMGDHVIV